MKEGLPPPGPRIPSRIEWVHEMRRVERARAAGQPTDSLAPLADLLSKVPPKQRVTPVPPRPELDL